MIESLQRKITNMIHGLRNMPHKEFLNLFNLQSLKGDGYEGTCLKFINEGTLLGLMSLRCLK